MRHFYGEAFCFTRGSPCKVAFHPSFLLILFFFSLSFLFFSFFPFFCLKKRYLLRPEMMQKNFFLAALKMVTDFREKVDQPKRRDAGIIFIFTVTQSTILLFILCNFNLIAFWGGIFMYVLILWIFYTQEGSRSSYQVIDFHL